ncbi:hypothetical protein GCM10025867_15270 [Frondihabitans sucicola]|uniref:Aldehyde dehydrogenase domain-containing protein n=1 Tax=Frondihabitans sucicola TaxID=1268041 RepID=A0ABN6XWJ5_9MICO|nr:hypothetical protein GCM10025867_15270 [Frondihabitans sucicola]
MKPRRLDDTGRFWSPGIRTGVEPGSEFHRVEYFGPVLGILTAATLDEAIDLQNATDFGLTAGLHTLDPSELETWLERVEAGNLYVNRGITGAIVRRQPFGGWKRSAVGAGGKAGGPNYLVHLGSWAPSPVTPTSTGAVSAPVSRLIAAAHDGAGSSGALAAIAAADEAAWSASFGRSIDVSQVGLERNVFRYRPVPVTVRLAEGGSPVELLRVLAAGLRAGAPLTVSSAIGLSAGVRAALGSASVTQASDADFLASASRGELTTSRVRLVGPAEARGQLAIALGGDPSVAVFAAPVTPSPRLELLPFLREQAVTVTAHRFGNPDAWSEGVL